MGIPESAVAQGGTYFWKGDREVPDMWHVTYDYPRKEMAVTFACSFHNRHVGEVAQFLGREMTLEVSPRFCRTYSAEWKPSIAMNTATTGQGLAGRTCTGRDRRSSRILHEAG
jgi:hypothetical protein